MLPLDFSSKIEIMKMNVLPKLLYLFQSLPVKIPQIFCVKWNRMISRFIWGGRKPRVKYEVLQLPKEDGGMALPKLEEYYISAQLRYIYCWCNPNYKAKWKDMEKELGTNPIQNLIGDREQYKKLNDLDPITDFTLNIWYGTIRKYKLQNELKVLKWVTYDSNFKPAQYDQGFEQWTIKGITT
ncbi:hypothetical protein LDENG_00079520 [Lucifuga dentata]|nr:hypothetical protein LDENG_00079520 [Lucifuga dentata]